MLATAIHTATKCTGRAIERRRGVNSAELAERNNAHKKKKSELAMDDIWSSSTVVWNSVSHVTLYHEKKQPSAQKSLKDETSLSTDSPQTHKKKRRLQHRQHVFGHATHVLIACRGINPMHTRNWALNAISGPLDYCSARRKNGPYIAYTVAAPF